MIPLTGWGVFDKESGVRLGESISMSDTGGKGPLIVDFLDYEGEIDSRDTQTVRLKRPQPADPDPAPKHPHTEALERLVRECKRFEKQLNGDNSWYIATFDVGIGTALKAAQDALEGDQ